MVNQYNFFHKKRRLSDSEADKSSLIDARITTEDGACLDHEVKKLKAISDAVNGKAIERNLKL